MDCLLPAGSVPVRRTSFVGRADDLVSLTTTLARSGVLTLTGPGGCGKTSLAARLVTELPEVRWVGLGSCEDESAVAAALLAALGIGALRGQDPVDRVATWLGERPLLVVLDNCEHVSDAAAKLVWRLQRQAPAARILATSRQPLGAAGEQVHQVPPLSLPPPGEIDVAAVLHSESGRLFADRAALALPGFTVDPGNAPAVTAICRRLDGLPLALELAAARVRSLPPRAIVSGLDQRFRLLTGGGADALPHQQTLIASVEWSHGLLSDAERVLLRRLSVFAGSFSLEAAEAIAGGGVLGRDDVLVCLADLVERGMVAFDGARYLLAQTIREFVAGGIDPAEDRRLRTAFVRYFAALAASAGTALSEAPRPEVLDRIEVEIDNLQAAISRSLATGDVEVASNLVGDLAVFWLLRGRYSEALSWARRVVDVAPIATAGRRRARWCLGQLGFFGMDAPSAFGSGEITAVIAEAGDADDPVILARSQALLQLMSSIQAPLQTVGGFADVIRGAEGAGDEFGLLSAHAYAALALVSGCDRPAEAAPHLDRLAAAAAGTGSPYWACWRGLCVGIAAVRAGSLVRAHEELRAAWDLAWTVGDPMLESWCAAWLAQVAVARDDAAGLEDVLARSLPLQQRSTILRAEWLLQCRADLATRNGDVALTEATLPAIDAAVRPFGIPFVLAGLDVLTARHRLNLGDLPGARSAAVAAASVAGTLGTPWWIAETALTLADVAEAEDQPGRAAAEALRAADLAVQHGFAVLGARALQLLGRLAVCADCGLEGARLLGASDALARAAGLVATPPERAVIDAAIATGRATVGPVEWDRAWAEGRELTLAQAAEYAGRARGERRRPSAGWDALTPTELVVVALVADGLSNAEIAVRLFISVATVKSHVHHVFTKLGVTSRTQLAAAEHARRQAAPV